MNENTIVIIIMIVCGGVLLGVVYWNWRRRQAEEDTYPPQGPTGQMLSQVLNVLLGIAVLTNMASCAYGHSSSLTCVSYGFTGLALIANLFYRRARGEGK